MTEIFVHRLDNGLWLVAERMASVQSLALTMLLPAGVAQEPPDQLGVSTLLAEMICRGAGALDAKAHREALDRLGVRRSTETGTHHLRLQAVMVGEQLPKALPLLMDMVRRPILPTEALEPARDLALQALDSLEDEPQEKVFIRLRQRHHPEPFGRSPLGQREHLERIRHEDVVRFWQRTFVPDGAVLGVAGKFDWSELRERVEACLGDWKGAVEEPGEQAPAPRGYWHEEADSTQVHIGLAYQTVAEADPRSLVARAAVAVLSGGMSSRLFTEVREKRGLCYAVGAHYWGNRQRGAVLCYAGTTAGRAQETLNVLVAELRRLSEGAQAEEFERAKVGMKASLVMAGESTSARAAWIAGDQYIFGRPRTLEELTQQIDAIQLEDLNTFLRDHPAGEMTIVTVGPEALQPPGK